jgi:hypothetical protein
MCNFKYFGSKLGTVLALFSSCLQLLYKEIGTRQRPDAAMKRHDVMNCLLDSIFMEFLPGKSIDPALSGPPRPTLRLGK